MRPAVPEAAKAEAGDKPEMCSGWAGTGSWGGLAAESKREFLVGHAATDLHGTS